MPWKRKLSTCKEGVRRAAALGESQTRGLPFQGCVTCAHVSRAQLRPPAPAGTPAERRVRAATVPVISAQRRLQPAFGRELASQNVLVPAFYKVGSA